MSLEKTVRLGTRGSALARWQTDHVAALLKAAHPDVHVEVEVITTQGDRVIDKPLAQVGGKGVFTAELEAALRSGAIDFAVHSLKDLPTDSPDGLTIGAIPERANPSDVLVSRDGFTLVTLPQSARVGTSSRRRAAQLLHLRPDLQILDIRGNVDTRIRKALDGGYEAILLAFAGLERLGRLEAISQQLSLDDMLPAPGQGALAVQCRDEAASLDLLAPIRHAATTSAVTAERAFLAGLGGGCSLPIAAYAEVDGATLYLRGRVNSPDGKQQIDVKLTGQVDQAETLGYGLADQALAQGAAALLESRA
ncbi:MAG TPA: hydroxymethylbilane synthase [Phototrophicaceae bacterium]|nr:hydroxymethylbilane synthase [Phototrophicaceae bacterium]